MSTGYVPDAGDVIWLNFDPQTGHEQAGHRPALVLSKRSYNAGRGMAVVCPMTSKLKKYAFEVVVSVDPPSAVLADQVKCMDWRARGGVFKGRVPEIVLARVRLRIAGLIGASTVVQRTHRD